MQNTGQNQYGNQQSMPIPQTNSPMTANGQSGSFTAPTWNRPARYVPIENPNVQNGMGRKPVRCFRCRQLGHYASNCPNPSFSEEYAPLCANCKQPGHFHYQCNVPFNPNNRDQKMQSTVQITEEPNNSKESPVHRVEVVQTVMTRNQKKDKGPIQILDGLTPILVNEPVLKSDSNPLLGKTSPLKPNPTTILVGPPIQKEPVPSQFGDQSHQLKEPILRTQLRPIGELVEGPVLEPVPVLVPVPITNISPISGIGGIDLPVPVSGVRKKKKALGIMTNTEPYDILKDLGSIQPTITMKQLLAVAPECRNTLNSSLIRQRTRHKEIREVSLNPDPGAPTIDVSIDGVLVQGVQVDGGASVNLMNADTMEELGLDQLLPTTLMLRMADSSRVQPMGILRDLKTTIAGIPYKIDYVVFQLQSTVLSYPILLGRPWLYQARARNDWGRGTLTIGKGKDKIVLQMYPVQYHGETQYTSPEFTTDCEEEITGAELVTSNIRTTNSQQVTEPNTNIYRCGGPGEYYVPLEVNDDSDHMLAYWMQGGDVHQVSAIEPELETSNLSDFMKESETEPTIVAEALLKPKCQSINLGTTDNPKMIQIYDGITGDTKQKWMDYFIRHKSAFAWSYKDLKGIPVTVCEHRIILEENATPIRQRQHRLNPKYSLMVKEELDKLLEVGFIYPVPHSEWVSPIVMVPKKNGKVRICQDFCKLNAATKKDYFPLPFTDSILDAVAGHKCYLFLDGFSGYNQVQIAQEDQLKTTFTTDWGTFAYKVMPFGLCNAPATFQRVMTQAFQNELRVSMEIFLDDFCSFSTRNDHLDKLGRCLDKCAEFGISLNSEKCQFGVPSGRLLGHIVSIAGIATDPDKIKIIVDLQIPNTVTGVRIFIGHVSYYRRFIYKFAALCMPLTNLLKKQLPESPEPIWTKECTVAFETLKQKLVSAPILVAPNWTKQFEVYVDASNVAIGSVLSQKDDKGHDHPIYYASRQLVAAEQNYTTTEREALGMIYSVQKFRHYLNLLST